MRDGTEIASWQIKGGVLSQTIDVPEGDQTFQLIGANRPIRGSLVLTLQPPAAAEPAPSGAVAAAPPPTPGPARRSASSAGPT